MFFFSLQCSRVKNSGGNKKMTLANWYNNTFTWNTKQGRSRSTAKVIKASTQNKWNGCSVMAGKYFNLNQMIETTYGRGWWRLRWHLRIRSWLSCRWIRCSSTRSHRQVTLAASWTIRPNSRSRSAWTNQTSALHHVTPNPRQFHISSFNIPYTLFHLIGPFYSWI